MKTFTKIAKIGSIIGGIGSGIGGIIIFIKMANNMRFINDHWVFILFLVMFVSCIISYIYILWHDLINKQNDTLQKHKKEIDLKFDAVWLKYKKLKKGIEIVAINTGQIDVIKESEKFIKDNKDIAN